MLLINDKLTLKSNYDPHLTMLAIRTMNDGRMAERLNFPLRVAAATVDSWSISE